MKISIIIPFYDKDHTYFPRIMSYLTELTFDKEVIFVDDRNDKSLNVRKEYDIPTEYRIVNSSVTGENVGTFETRKTGIRAATCEYIWFIDIDDQPLPIELKIDENNKKDMYIYNSREYILDENCFCGEHDLPLSKLNENKHFLFPVSNKNKNIIFNLTLKNVDNDLERIGFLRFFTMSSEYIAAVIWNKIINRKLLLETINRTDFEKGFSLGEDTVLFRLIFSTRKSISIQLNLDPIYIYNVSTRDKYLKNGEKIKLQSLERRNKFEAMKNKYTRNTWFGID